MSNFAPPIIKVSVGTQQPEKINSLSYGQARRIRDASDLQLNDPQNNQVMTYDSSTGGFKLTFVAGTVTNLDEGFF